MTQQRHRQKHPATTKVDEVVAEKTRDAPYYLDTLTLAPHFACFVLNDLEKIFLTGEAR